VCFENNIFQEFYYFFHLLLETAGKSTPSLVTGQIIGGTKATQKQFPWQVYMTVEDSWLCGGSMILADWVLTAAHCVYGYFFNI